MARSRDVGGSGEVQKGLCLGLLSFPDKQFSTESLKTVIEKNTNNNDDNNSWETAKK